MEDGIIYVEEFSPENSFPSLKLLSCVLSSQDVSNGTRENRNEIIFPTPNIITFATF